MVAVTDSREKDQNLATASPGRKPGLQIARRPDAQSLEDSSQGISYKNFLLGNKPIPGSGLPRDHRQVGVLAGERGKEAERCTEPVGGRGVM